MVLVEDLPVLPPEDPDTLLGDLEYRRVEVMALKTVAETDQPADRRLGEAVTLQSFEDGSKRRPRNLGLRDPLSGRLKLGPPQIECSVQLMLGQASGNRLAVKRSDQISDILLRKDRRRKLRERTIDVLGIDPEE